MNKYIISFVLLIASTRLLGFKTDYPEPDVYEDISNAIRSGDAKQVAVFFGSSVDLTVPNQEDVYSKTQAEFMIKDFFSKNPVKSFSIVHKGSSKDGILFMVGNYVSSNGKTFRTSIVLKTTQGKYFIQQLRFENQ